MTAESLMEDIGSLLDLWVAGWAGARGYDVDHVGRFPAVDRNDSVKAREFFAVNPDNQDFGTLAEQTLQTPGRLLTVLTRDPQRYLALADQHGLHVSSTSQAMMIVDMDTQDTEDPWLPDDDLEVSYSERDGVHFAEVRAGDVVAASGRVFVTDGTVAVFDQIVTNDDFRRRGLGSFIMKSLAARSFAHPVEVGLLLASADGRHLYAHLGWEEVCTVVMLSSSDAGVKDVSVS
ncbi:MULTISPECIES: GNAT family N-acetyltransferase [Arthrobacter]|uniref:GNAT family N-acetyltransferase n=2 Tax=Arthrobacter TaxID=1663 RepID=A0ABU9KKY6_9MICC|nr:GNAT family N-acetyltransferase [Arthrobacter sp. YJM1]MDP5227569.1 GNAT family N-acetyltransferase [Arthrobacter sp. YJM1]